MLLPTMLPLVLGGVLLAVAEVEPTLPEAPVVPEVAGVEAVPEAAGVEVEAVAEVDGALPVEAVAEVDGEVVVVVVVVVLVEALGELGVALDAVPVLLEDVPTLCELCPDTPLVLAEAVVPEPVAPPAIFSTLTWFFTLRTPLTDSASFLASLLSFLVATLPCSSTTPFPVTVTLTELNAGFVDNCCCTLACKS